MDASICFYKNLVGINEVVYDVTSSFDEARQQDDLGFRKDIPQQVPGRLRLHSFML